MSALLAAAALSAFALVNAEISISSPSGSEYWVQNVSNTIRWSYGSGDPNPISIIINAANETTLNGEFSIAEYVDLSLESYTVTDVSLKTGSQYTVSFVNTTNHTDVYSTSAAFEVREPGTTPAASSGGNSPSSSGGSSPSGSGSGSGSGSNSGSGSPTASASGAEESDDGSDGALSTSASFMTLAGAMALAGLVL